MYLTKEVVYTLFQTSAVFQISITTIRKWEKQLKKEGNLKKHSVIRRFKKIDPEKLRAYVKDNPDAYLREISLLSDRNTQSIDTSENYAKKRPLIERNVFTK